MKDKSYYTYFKVFKLLKVIYVNGQRTGFQLIQYLYCPRFYANKICINATETIKGINGEQQYFCIEEVELDELEKKKLSMFNIEDK